eukprot:TRINITY_DN939_c1_g3_i1.p1 TRINITY_DN939_c1_g3~~TRINITY_DN939_c1_g3_i1.p1  ORF type:complete len:955 (+),score=262.03 TRINITY_DN939_c1_g3_i1:145-3009(+)
MNRSSSEIGAGAEYERYDGLDGSLESVERYYEEHPWAELWCRMLLNQKKKIAAVWTVLTLLSIAGAINGVGRTTVDVEAPYESPSQIAKGKFAALFPDEGSSTTFVVLMSRNDGYPRLDLSGKGPLPYAIRELRERVSKWSENPANGAPSNFVQAFGDYFNYTAAGLPQLARLCLNDDNSSTIATISVRARVSDDLARTFSNFLDSEVANFTLTQGSKFPRPYYSGQLISSPTFEAEAHKSQYLDITELVTSVTPITFGLMAFLLRSLRLVTIAIACTLVTSLISFGLMFVVSLCMPVATFTPVFLLAVCLSTTVAYTLILLHRYREALLHARHIAQRPDRVSATGQAVTGVATTIAVSGLTLATTFIALTIYPMNNIRSFGITCGCAILIVVMCVVTGVPTLLLVSKWFLDCVKPNPWWDMWDAFWEQPLTNIKEYCCKKYEAEEDRTAPQPVLDGDLVDEGYDSDWNDSFRNVVPTCRTPAKPPTKGVKAEAYADEPLLSAADGIDETSRWFRIGKFVSMFPVNLIVVVLIVLVALPVDLRSTDFQITADSMSMVPLDAPVLKGYMDLGEYFRSGEVYPYYIILNATAAAPNITDYDSWNKTAQLFFAMAGAVNETDKRENINLFDSASLTRGNNGLLNDFALMKKCLANTSQDPSCPLLEYASQYISKDQRSMWAKFTSPFAPMTSEGLTWLRNIRAIDYNSSGLFDVYIAGEPAETMDSMWGGVQRVPDMVAFAFGCVFVLNVLRAKSLFIAIRALCTRAISLAFAYGLAEIAYGEGMLSWLNDHLDSESREISYVVALTALPILAGLGLGPDFFLTMRIIESRRASFDSKFPDLTRRAVVLGVARSGYVIFMAGLMIFTCFTALLIFSRTTVHHQLAWYIAAGVAFETFIVGPFFIPACTALMGQIHPTLNWWPLALTPWRSVCPCSRRDRALLRPHTKNSMSPRRSPW